MSRVKAIGSLYKSSTFPYLFTISVPDPAFALAGDSQDNVNKVAERVLLRLKQKLQGTEDGVQLSISGQVNHLIQEATDPKNLCRLFPGWQAYI